MPMSVLQMICSKKPFLRGRLKSKFSPSDIVIKANLGRNDQEEFKVIKAK